MAENLTIVEAAAYIGCRPATLRAWKAQSRGPRYFRAGRLIRYRRTDLDEWIIDQLAIPTSTPTCTGTKNTEKRDPENVPGASTVAPSPRLTSPPSSSPGDSRLALLRRRRLQEQ